MRLCERLCPTGISLNPSSLGFCLTHHTFQGADATGRLRERRAGMKKEPASRMSLAEALGDVTAHPDSCRGLGSRLS